MGQIGQAILDGIFNAVFVLWDWLLQWTIGFIPNYVLVTVLVAVGIVAYLTWGIKGLVAFGLTVLAAMELQRRARPDGTRGENQWPDQVPIPKKPRGKGKRQFNHDTGLWEKVVPKGLTEN